MKWLHTLESQAVVKMTESWKLCHLVFVLLYLHMYNYVYKMNVVR